MVKFIKCVLLGATCLCGIGALLFASFYLMGSMAMLVWLFLLISWIIGSILRPDLC